VQKTLKKVAKKFFSVRYNVYIYTVIKTKWFFDILVKLRKCRYYF